MNQEFVYFKSVPGKLATRFGTRFKTYIGAEVERIPPPVDDKGKPLPLPEKTTIIRWSDEPVAIPKAELARYRREYARLVREGSLIQVPTDSKP